MDIHNYKRRLERTLQNVNSSKEISIGNRKVLLKFHDNCFSEGLSICKTERYLYDLFRLAKTVEKDFQELTKDDLLRIVADIEKREWSAHSKQTFKVLLKKFFRWLEGTEEYPEKIKWLKTNLKNNHRKLPEELITEEEIEKMVRNCGNQRDRALISILYESGCRIGEIGNLKIKDINFDEFGARINISGKTGSRIVRLVNSAPYIQEWVNMHPNNQDRDSYIWSGRQGNSISYARISSIIKNSARKANISKRIYPHLLRHSRATLLAGYLTEAQMKEYLGWAQSSKMCGVYIHLNGKDTDKAILKLNGVEVNEEQQSQKLKPKTCKRCKSTNESTNKFCKICGFVLDDETAKEIIRSEEERKQADEVMDRLVKDPEIMELIKKKLGTN